MYDAGDKTSGVYKIKPDGVNEVKVYCEQDDDGGGWTVSQPLRCLPNFQKT